MVADLDALTFLITAAFYDDPDFSAAMRPLLAYWSYCVGFGLAGFGLAAIFRNQTGAMVVVLVWPFVLEPIINGVLFAFNQTSDGIRRAVQPAARGGWAADACSTRTSTCAGFGELDTWGLGASLLVFWVGVLVPGRRGIGAVHQARRLICVTLVSASQARSSLRIMADAELSYAAGPTDRAAAR